MEARLALTGFTAFNGLFASGETAEHTTFYADMPGQDASGQLRNIVTGESTGVTLTTTAIGVNFGGNGVQPAAGTDAYDIFSGFVDFSAGGTKSIEISGGDAYQYTFENLDPGATYQFAGTAVRGNSGYTDRWTLVSIIGADSFSSAHSSGTGVLTNGLQPNEVAIWTGDNSGSNQGYVAQWTGIAPGADGVVTIASRQYTGAIPTGGQAGGNKGYGIAGIRLIENVPAGPPAVENNEPTDVMAFAATIGGDITTTGGQIPNVKIYYGAVDGGTNPSAWSQVVDIGRTGGDFSVVLDDLQQNTDYFFRAFAENSLGNDWADTSQSFTTLAASRPAVINLPATSVGAFAATLAGRITDTGNDSPLVTVFYGDNDGGTDPNRWDNSVELGVQSGTFSANVTDLDPLSTYFYSSRATNLLGPTWAATVQSFVTTETPPLQINELMADNATTLDTRTRLTVGGRFVGDRITPDWIEIHNPTAQTADLGGFHLTNDPDEPTLWQFPAGTLVPADGFLVVFASGLDLPDARLDERGNLHANFVLDASGGYGVAITDATGEVVSQIASLPLQSEDISYGLDAAAIERFFSVPTPGTGNANDTPKAPTISVASRTFTDTFSVELTPHVATHSIRYTLNEQRPTASSTLYTGPFEISSTTQLRAVSVAPNGKLSTIVSASYVQLAASVLGATSNLPYVIVETFGDSVPTGSSFGDTFIALIEPGDDGRSRLADRFDIETRGGIHVRGSSSSGFAKKQYRVEFWDEQNEDRKQAVLGLPKEADWIFYGPSQFDRVLISNPLMFDLSNQIGRYATRTRYVEMYLNSNGGSISPSDYVGIYAITEVIEQGNDRVNVADLTTGAGGLPVEGGFVWKNDRGSAYVDPDTTTTAQRSYIDGWINDLQRAAASPNFTDPDVGYAKYADVGSFIDHNILNLLSMNVDALRLSSFYFKTADGKLEAGPIWDFDRSLDSTDGRDNNPRSWFGTGDSTRYFDDSDRVMSWWSDMFQDPDFVQAYIDRWSELRQNEFSLDNINATIDTHAAEIGEAAARDYARWAGSRYGNFAGEIDHLKTWLRQRIEWIDSRWLTAPTFSLENPQVAPGTQVSITGETGDVYYTLDGSDPRGENGSVRPEAIRAAGPIVVNGFTQITARIYKPTHGSASNGYVATGDDWSAPSVAVYSNDPIATGGNLSISEVHYNPSAPSATEAAAGHDNNDDFEFIELVNPSAQNVVLTGVTLSRVDVDGTEEGVDFDFSTSTIKTLGPGERILVVENVEAFTARYGSQLPVAGQWAGSLSNNREALTLKAFDGSVIQQFSYNDRGQWPARADGTGSSLEVVDVADDLGDPRNWQASVDFHGSPGQASSAAFGVVINEVLAHTDPPLTPSDSIELYNTTFQPISIGGWYLSDAASNLLKFQIPAGTVLAPKQYIVFDESDFNPTPLNPEPNDFALSSARGDDVWLTTPDGSGGVAQFVDDVHFTATPNGESLGRVPDGGPTFAPMSSRTFGSTNAAPRVGPVIISELQYAPAPPSINEIVIYPELTVDDLEYVEIYNPTITVVDLTAWRLRGAVDFDFDPGTVLPAGGTLLVISFSPSRPENDDRLLAFRTHYGLDASVPIVGGYAGKLNDLGESVRIQRPDEPPAEDPSLIPRMLEDEVAYAAAAPWPTTATGTGQSLTRVSSSSYGNAAASWRAAPSTPGRNSSAADVNRDGLINSVDIDLVCAAIHTGDGDIDLNLDGTTNRLDLEFLVSDLLRTTAGDANADGIFNSTDLIQIFTAGEYEDGVVGNSRWSEGDWNCDGEFDSSDLVAAFAAGGYVQAARR